MKKSRSSLPQVNRRRFLRAGGLAAAGLAGTASKGATAPLPAPASAVLETDVVVCGGGCAGLAAALAAARNGARTLLLERAGFAGGIVTSVGLPYFDGIANIKNNLIISRGIALELLQKSGVALVDDTHVHRHNPTIDNIERFKLLADSLITAEKNLQVLYHSMVCGVTMDGDRIAAVMVANKGGLMHIKAKTVIDCTGDGDVAYWSGATMDKSDELQPLTLHFRIGNVTKGDKFGERCLASLQKAQEHGELPMFYGPGVMFLFAHNEAYIHGVRVPADATDPADLTRAEIQGRKDAWAMFEAWKRDMPDFKDSYFCESGPYIGARETRRLVGEYVLTENDVMENRPFEDAIATGSWFLDVHPNKTVFRSAGSGDKYQPDPYDIPYRTLYTRKVANLLVAGRCHSTTRRANGSTRVTVTAMALGQAAGTAAAYALGKKKEAQEIEGKVVRDLLRQQGGGVAKDWA